MTHRCLEHVLTAGEAAKKWGLTNAAISQACRDGRLRGARKTGRDWLVLVSEMHRVYGKPKR